MCIIAVLVLNVIHPGSIFWKSRLAIQVLGSGSLSTEMGGSTGEVRLGNCEKFIGDAGSLMYRMSTR
jgi:hypothetical protein